MYGEKGVFFKNWFSFYPDDRQQTVDLKLPKFSNSSKWHTIECGRPAVFSFGSHAL
jgi:hypothetical protein